MNLHIPYLVSPYQFDLIYDPDLIYDV